ncbi:MAG TPA: LPS export ABC transporter permease LptG, partial [Candidatus Binatia bacterium]|nr:LPS export ABC transporter permease LptG [Candidatus Binatia bacterium]
TAMRASGVSLLRIGGATVIAGAILGAGAFAIGDWAAPQGQQLADDLKAGVKGKGGMGGKSVWLREGPHVFHVRKLITEDHVGALDIYTLGADLSLSAATHVEEGVYEKGQWEFSRVHRTEFADGAATVLELPSLDWHGTLSPEVLKLFVLEADALSVRGLLRLIRYLRQNSLDSRSYELALDRKLVAPLTVMTMMLFAIPFVLGPLRNTGAGQRLFVGILVGLGFYVINEVTANTGQIYGWYPLLAASAPTLVFAGIGAWRLQRVR